MIWYLGLGLGMTTKYSYPEATRQISKKIFEAELFDGIGKAFIFQVSSEQ